MTGNTIGEEFEIYVAEQIKQRQTNQYAGYNSLRTPEQLQYLNNTTTWAKLASGVEFVKEENGYRGLDRLKGLISDDQLEKYAGKELARKTVLFNGLTEIDSATYEEGKKTSGLAKNQSRFGYSKDKSIWNDNTAYGLGGPDYGQQPMPGIQSISIKSLNRGSIKEANVKIKAYNKNQFAILELLYLRIGFTMMLEWGNDKYIDNNGEFKSTGNTIVEDLWFVDRYVSQTTAILDIERYREIYSGNYDGFFGKVSNFTWTFASDGSYDIDLKLITMGDVIESLQLNIQSPPSQMELVKQKLEDIEENPSDNPAYTGFNEEETEYQLINAAQTTILGKYLFDSIAWNDYWKPSQKLDYFKYNLEKFKEKKTLQKYCYFVTFGELIRLVQSYTVNQVKNGNVTFSQISIEDDEGDNKINYYPNQISLDPRICIFKYKFGGIDLGNPLFDAGSIRNPTILNPLKDYIQKQGTNVIYGSLMNIYLNYDFISKCLNDTQEDGVITIFKFFQKICNGINSSLGGVNNIEPIVKNDNVLTFIDQNPIPGYLESFENAEDAVDLEVYGYNSATTSSNFVTDISFKTSITPELSSIISIGTTAGGSSTGNDSTAFSFWNTGLRDRYQNNIIEPSGKIAREKEEESIKSKVKVLVNYWKKNTYYVLYYNSYDHNWKADKYGTMKMTEYKNRYRALYESTEADYPGLSGKKLSVRQFVNQALWLERKKKQLKLRSQGEVMSSQNTNYIFTLAEAFGGNTNETYLNYNSDEDKYFESKMPNKYFYSKEYFKFDSEFISRCKTTYKTYLNSIQNQTYIKATPDDRSPSGTIGFIPIGFDLKLQGISGIKIYNKLNINSNFLPSQYPKALKFLITKVDHKITNNKWETSLSSLSIPKTVAYKKVNLEYTTGESQTTEAAEGDQKPLYGEGELKIILNYGVNFNGKDSSRSKKTEISLSTLLAEFNPTARPSFEGFFKEMQQNYKGYQIVISALGRSIDKSKALRSNPKNAKVGKSRHNYYASIDFNAVEPDGSYLKKSDKNQPGKWRTIWTNQGFAKLANKHGLVWGGNFQDYEDCVHFAYTKASIDIPVANAIKKYGEIKNTGVPNLKGTEGRNVELDKLV